MIIIRDSGADTDHVKVVISQGPNCISLHKIGKYGKETGENYQQNGRKSVLLHSQY